MSLPESSPPAPATRRLALDAHPNWCERCTFDSPGLRVRDSVAVVIHDSRADLPGGVALLRADNVLGRPDEIAYLVGRPLVYVPPVEQHTIEQARAVAAGIVAALALLDGDRDD